MSVLSMTAAYNTVDAPMPKMHKRIELAAAGNSDTVKIPEGVRKLGLQVRLTGSVVVTIYETLAHEDLVDNGLAGFDADKYGSISSNDIVQMDALPTAIYIAQTGTGTVTVDIIGV